MSENGIKSTATMFIRLDNVQKIARCEKNSNFQGPTCFGPTTAAFVTVPGDQQNMAVYCGTYLATVDAHVISGTVRRKLKSRPFQHGFNIYNDILFI